MAYYKKIDHLDFCFYILFGNFSTLPFNNKGENVFFL